ncbi:MAG: FAD:protein FMN transferase [Verrucomicrobiaceae bacterium]|nr:FAD:protein FMN transferase [Verrucomicrobiaceae bacterium]
MSLVPRIIRVLLVAAAVWVIRVYAPLPQAVDITADRIKDFFPAIDHVTTADHRGVQTVFDKSGIKIGYVLQTSPASDDIVGYSGPTNSLIALDAAGKVAGVRILRSEDTPEHVAEVIADRGFFQQFRKKEALQSPEFVSGATLTSQAIASGIQKRLGSSASSLRFPGEITLTEVRSVLPDAASMLDNKVFDREGNLIGNAIRTSPVADSVIGYKGPSDTLVILSPDKSTVLKVRLRGSFDTEAYVGYVTGDRHFLESFANMPVSKLAELDFAKEGIEGVSGATETSYAVAEGLRKRAKTLMEQSEVIRWRWQDTGHLIVIVMAGLMAFTSLRGYTWLRHLHHGILVVYGGWVVGEMLSQALFVGWARHQIPWSSAPGLALLLVVALCAPVLTGRQIYCHHICPHGALQQLLARRLKWQWRPGPRVLAVLEHLPSVLLGAVVFICVFGWGFNFNSLEPFDAYVLRVAGWGSIAVFVIGLVVACLIPMGYCRFGCPTGALFAFLRFKGSSDRLGWRELVASLILLLAVLPMLMKGAPSKLFGSAFGTRWKVERATPLPTSTERQVSSELERLEAIFSMYRDNSEVMKVNRSRSLDWIAVSSELAELFVKMKHITAIANGALDPTVGHLGRGDQVARAKLTGWDSFEVRCDPPAIRKHDVDVVLDPTCLVEGYALARVDEILRSQGSNRHLIEIGGEIRACGEWRVGIQMPNPRAPAGEVAAAITLSDETISTSGRYRQPSHLVNPVTREPARSDLCAVTVQSADSMLADGLATALMILGPTEGKRIAELNGINAIFLVGGAGE